MILLKSIRNRHFHTLHKLQNPCNLRNPISHSFFPPLLWWPFSVSAHFKPIESEFPENTCQKSKKPLCVFFKESIGVFGKTDNSEPQERSVGVHAELIGKLKILEEEVRCLNKVTDLNREKNDASVGQGKKRSSLLALFADEKIKAVDVMNYGIEDPGIYRNLSSAMQIFAHLLFVEGYLKDANFMPRSTFDSTKLENGYAREFLKFAAANFGRDHQEIAKWLSACDLKELALFGCPSVAQKTVFAAKRLRIFFEIEEHKVCQKCALRGSCKHKNQVRKATSKLDLSDVMRVLIMYAMESVPPKLVVPEKIKNCVSHLLKEVVNLSQTA